MSRTIRKYNAASVLMLLSAALHLPIGVLAFGRYGIAMFVVAAIWAAFGFGLLGQRRWCAYLGFLAMIFGISAAIGGAMDNGGMVAVLFWVIVAVNLLAGVVLFALLWRGRAPIAT